MVINTREREREGERERERDRERERSLNIQDGGFWVSGVLCISAILHVRMSKNILRNSIVYWRHVIDDSDNGDVYDYAHYMMIVVALRVYYIDKTTNTVFINIISYQHFSFHFKYSYYMSISINYFGIHWLLSYLYFVSCYRLQPTESTRERRRWRCIWWMEE